MKLTPAERDRVLIASVAALARRRHERGLLLNVPEATAVICDAVIESARDGDRLEQAVHRGSTVLSEHDVLPGVVGVLTEVSLEAVFDDGTHLVVITDPFGVEAAGDEPTPGEILPGAQEVSLRQDGLTVSVTNESKVPIGVTSHWHFFEANPKLRFDRAAAYGRRLDISAGSSVRFEPGTTTTVNLVPFGGRRVVVGFAGLVDGQLDEPGAKERAMARVREFGYFDVT